jgi:MMP 1-O-methyltransferase
VWPETCVVQAGEEGPIRGEDDHDEEQEEEEAVIGPRLAELVERTKGFMPVDEGNALFVAATSVAVEGPFLEVGAYCGKSSVYLGCAAAQKDTVLFSLDHHRGSEENQAGWEHHDAEVVDPATGRMDTLPFFRRTVEAAQLEDVVVALVGKSAPVARAWKTPLALLFIDGGHGVEPARQDYLLWTPKVAPGGFLAIHDVFPDPADGGRPPYEEIYLPALRSGLFDEQPQLNCGSLRVLRRA